MKEFTDYKKRNKLECIEYHGDQEKKYYIKLYIMPNKVIRVNQIPVKVVTQRPSLLAPLLFNITKVKVKKRK